jgi:hypothetical protein
MSKIEEHEITDPDVLGPNGKAVHVAYVTPAKQEDVDFVLKQDPDSDDGRSPWVWVRLSSGDLLLGVFPEGDTYCEVADKNQV